MSDLMQAVENCKKSKGWDGIPFNLHQSFDELFVECVDTSDKLKTAQVENECMSSSLLAVSESSLENNVEPMGSPHPYVNERILCSEILSCIQRFDGKIGLASAIGILEIVKVDLMASNDVNET